MCDFVRPEMETEEHTTGGGKRSPSDWVLPTVYATPDGESHFGTKTVVLLPFTGIPATGQHSHASLQRLSSAGTIGSLSDLMALKGVIFRSTPPDYDFDWHCAPRKQVRFLCKSDPLSRSMRS